MQRMEGVLGICQCVANLKRSSYFTFCWPCISNVIV